MNSEPQCEQLIHWIDSSPTAYHAVELVKNELIDNGFTALDESDVWHLSKGGKYYVQRRDASIVAFIYGEKPLEVDGLRIIGAHTDSPTLKVKPNPERLSQSYFQLGIEVYGGALLNPWFDRDLSIAGRVAVKNGDSIALHLVDFKRPIAVIPNLAIHLDRNANNERTVNPQTDMQAILLQTEDKNLSFKDILAKELNLECVSSSDILDYDLNFYDVQGGSIVGLNNEFLCCARLDNLLSSFVGLQAFLKTDTQHSSVLALFDHEEVGSQSDIGAKSNFLNTVLERLVPDSESRYRMLHHSLLLSVDNAHGIHPNYPAKHDQGNGPKLNQGPVIKFDANQSYATSTDTAGLLRVMADSCDIPVQSYVTRADMRCGSTIGPMSAAQTGIKTVDLGVPTFAMHSIREMAGVKDTQYLETLLSSFLKTRTTSLK